MIIAVSQFRWSEFRRKIFGGWNKHRHDQFTHVDNMRERSISILQKRYGYTRDQAIYQLDKYYPNAWLG